MKKILVPTDFSDNALKAATYASELATRTGAGVYLLHAAQIGHEKFSDAISIYEKYNNLVLEDSHEKLEKLKSILSQNYPGIHYQIKVDPDLRVADAVKKACREDEIDFIIMGTSGASGLRSVLLGTVAASVISSAERPVLTIPSSFIPSPPASLLLATSHFEHDPFLMNTIHELISAFPSKLHIVTCEKTSADVAERKNVLVKLTEYGKYIGNMNPGLEVITAVLEGDQPEDAIELYSLQHDVDIICLVSYHASFMEKILLRSTTRNMSFHSRLPVLAIPVTCMRTDLLATGA